MKNLDAWVSLMPSNYPFLQPQTLGLPDFPLQPPPSSIVIPFYSLATSPYSVTRGTRGFLRGSDITGSHLEDGAVLGKEA